MQQITLLGSTGSIGKSTLSVLEKNPQHFRVLALVADSNLTEMVQQCLRFCPRFAALHNADAALQLQQQLKSKDCPTEVLAGQRAICQLAALSEADQVVAAIVGVAGLLPTLAAIQAGKRVLLANKESLVTCGRLFMQAVQQSGAQLLPLDSEHNGIFQCLPVAAQQALGTAALERYGIHQLILTGSGGPLRQVPLAALAQVSPEQACAHPSWSMGRKISVDSATMMNKGLEYIEARWLFNAAPQQLAVVLHPQSLIHAMVTFVDGGVLTQCGRPDMRTAIGYALAYPKRIATGVAPLDFSTLAALTFESPDPVRYPCFPLAIAACNAGQAATTILNAANEVAVEAFLKRQLRFTDIVKINEQVLSTVTADEPSSVEAVLAIDQQARQMAHQIIRHQMADV